MAEQQRQAIEEAPVDGTMLWLLVDYGEHDDEDGGAHPLDDASYACWTIGFNNDGNVLEGEGVGWQFAGWCWSHDHFTEGRGKVIAWKPIGFDLAVNDPIAELALS